MPIDPRRIEVIDDMQAEILRRKGRMHSIQIVCDGWRLMRSLIRSQTQRMHPDWSDQQIEREVSRRMANGKT